ncbi:SPOR domain-containing protein [Aestuariispira insulae]|uniref:Cell division protein FtsN n=1 Tax=Aestuariispira insulae TaxID=1461337 RepID=A0A3D9HNH0_9PROT|nr:SPOR domain-containing protein [Aestuariispira insulae]RED51032.1 cell division protein FtsN [Aestuariispira insulae]
MSKELDELDRELSGLERQQLSSASKGGMKVLPIAVALVALTSFGGVIWYAYNQGVRSGSEEAAPLLTPEGAAKVQPQDPGGLQIPHQDKLVYNQVEPNQDDTKIERLLPPPEQPKRPPEPVVTEPATPPIPSITEPAEDTLPQTRMGADGKPRPPEPQTPDEPRLPSPDLAAPESPPVIEKIVETPKVEKAPEPAPKQEPEKTASANPAEPAPAPVTPKPVSGKDWRIQISAVKSAEAAQSEWKRQQGKNNDLLGKLSLQVQEIEIKGKGTFFRVRGGPLDSQESAQKLCNDLKKRKVSCIIVKPGA